MCKDCSLTNRTLLKNAIFRKRKKISQKFKQKIPRGYYVNFSRKSENLKTCLDAGLAKLTLKH